MRRFYDRQWNWAPDNFLEHTGDPPRKVDLTGTA